MDKKFVVAALLGCMVSGMAYAAPDVPPDVPPAYDIAGQEMQRTQDMLERARVEQQIEEDRAKANSRVEAGESQAQEQENAAKVTLKRIVTDPSAVLTDAELDLITKDYIGVEVTVKDLYAMVAKINKLYEEKGRVTCRAFLQAQTLQDGVLKVTLIEGRNGKTTLEGNRWTKEKYIKNRMHLQEGEIPTLGQLNNDLLWFNATNDCQLRLQLQAGEKPGTTDYVLQVYEPQKHNIVLFTDNAGNDVSGVYRAGLYYTIKSLSGVRDTLTLGTLETKGVGSFSSNYSRPIGLKGTKLNLGYSTNAVESLNGEIGDAFNTKGRATSYSIGFSQPWIVTEKTRSEVSLDFSQQNSLSDVLVTGGPRFNQLDSTYKDVTLGFSLTNYGRSSVIYHRHSLNYGKMNNTAYDDNSLNYFIYRLNGFYQKGYQHGQLITARGDFQKASQNLHNASAKGFYFGGMNTVRGYKESFMGYSDGINLSFEYSVPVSKDRLTHVYTFLDYGHGYGEAVSSTGAYNEIASLGLGVKTTIKQKYNLNLSVGRALKASFPDMSEGDINRYRVNFFLSGQF